MNSDNISPFMADFADPDYTDTFEYSIRDPHDRIAITEIAEALLGSKQAWLKGLFALRDTFAGAFGLKTAATHPSAEERIHQWEPGTQAGIFRVFDRAADWIVLGDDDTHLSLRLLLDFRVCAEDEATKRVTATTLVKIHNRLGRCYFFVIKPFHRSIVPRLLMRNFSRLEADVRIKE